MTPNVTDSYHGNAVNDFAALKPAGIVGVIHKCTQVAGQLQLGKILIGKHFRIAQQRDMLASKAGNFLFDLPRQRLLARLQREIRIGAQSLPVIVAIITLGHDLQLFRNVVQ